MNSRDLRVGNWLKYNNRLVIVDEILFEGINLTHEGAEYKYEDLKPIELTEEILLKWGGMLHGIEYIIKARALPIKIRFNSGIAYCEFANVYLGDSIKHLHQLQNLYYALCNEELNVQL